MTLSQFFKHFDLLADQPDAVAKMRELVWQLAVTGKLFPQNPKDESAGTLLGRIAAAKAAAVKANKLKAPIPAVPIRESDMAFDLPRGWAWAKLADLCLKLGAGSTPLGGKNVYQSEGIRFLRSQNVWNDGLQLDDVAFISPAIHANMSATNVEAGDILLNITGASIGRCAVVPDDFDEANVSQHVAIVRLVNKSLRQFIHLCVISPDFQQRIMDVQVGVSREGLSMTRLKEFVVAVPPLAEQRRIVAKVDELMALCDELTARQQARHDARARLTQSAYHHLTTAKTPADFRHHFNFIIRHSSFVLDDVPQLRQAILQLAVQGRLVPQNPKDESASTTLQKCAVDLKEWFVAAEDERYAIPSPWTWLRFGGVGEQRLGKMLDAHKNRGEPKSYLRNTNVQWMRFDLEDVKEMRVEKEEESELRLRNGDLLICEGGEPGRCAIWREETPEMYFQKALHRVRPCAAILPEYLALNLQVDCHNEVLAEYFTGATIKHLTGRSLSVYSIPVPPLAEQKRIVARVEALLRQCDALEAQLRQTRTLGAHLLDSTLHHLLAA